MASEHVVVQIFRGDNLADDTIRRPVRLAPDGYAGVVYDGAVYPLHQGDWIDLNRKSCEPEDAKRFLIAGAAIPYAPSDSAPATSPFSGFAGEWHLETTGFGHYVLFDGPERTAISLIEELDRNGLSVQRWDVSHRVADNQRQYDWFARLRTQAPHDEIVVLVRAIFSAPHEPAMLPIVVPEADRIAQLRWRVEDLAGQFAQTYSQLALSEIEVASLAQRLADEVERAERLSQLLARSRRERKHSDATGAAQRGDAHSRAIELARNEAEELLEFALAENAELERIVQELTTSSHNDAERIRSLDENLAHTNELLSELGAQERRSARRVFSSPPRGIIAFIQSAFPRLDFVLDSIESLELFEAPQALMRALVNIDKGEMIGKDLEGISGWREVAKIATGVAGSEALGRVYYRPGGQRLLVCVHIKQDDKEQARLIRRLESLQ